MNFEIFVFSQFLNPNCMIKLEAELVRPGLMKGGHLYLYPPKKWRRRLLMDYFLPGRRASSTYFLIKGTEYVIARVTLN